VPAVQLTLEAAMRALLLVSIVLSSVACGDDSDGGDGADAAVAGEANVIWECICRGMGEVNGQPVETMETIEHCAASDPTDMLSERYRKAAEALGRGNPGSCDDCDKTDTDCEPDAG
jgi:hypothetical protein